MGFFVAGAQAVDVPSSTLSKVPEKAVEKASESGRQSVLPDFIESPLVELNSIKLNSVELNPIEFNPINPGPQYRYFKQLNKAGLLLLNAQGVPLISHAPDRAFVPASTTKLLTALLALRHWGADYRFKTAFYLTSFGSSLNSTLKTSSNTPSNTKTHSKSPVLPSLVVKGYGDPFLISEEITLMAKELATELASQGIHRLAGIQIDNSYYQATLDMPGAGDSDNPYDAIPSALAANFNTVYIRKTH
ncbi:MAG: hypothetical protein GXO35_08630, partial [Gammaproteobacteria bacterium]|nr:hypothetical protein [Gammaproteobacteria bacterium]